MRPSDGTSMSHGALRIRLILDTSTKKRNSPDTVNKHRSSSIDSYNDVYNTSSASSSRKSSYSTPADPIDVPTVKVQRPTRPPSRPIGTSSHSSPHVMKKPTPSRSLTPSPQGVNLLSTSMPTDDGTTKVTARRRTVSNASDGRISGRDSPSGHGDYLSSSPTNMRPDSPNFGASVGSLNTWASQVDSSVLEDVSTEERKRQESIFELISTEQTYLRDLQLIVEDNLSTAELGTIFSNVEDLLLCNTAILSDFENRQRDNGAIIEAIGDIFLTHILHYTPKDHSDHEDIMKALDVAEQILEQANEVAKQHENKAKLDEVTRVLDMESLPEKIDLAAPTRFLGARQFMMEGPLAKAKSGRKLYAYLFNDIFILAQPIKGLSPKGYLYTLYRPVSH
ncbi:Dbl homology domain-containing protein [Endogone sp. FLAS-F59071]|nr:Dbl homology domain-containing protein [Endogone sp. FLAS-F59071]|eukprot:RUS19507.1 Dbl homology domain-containing protein [Endogone sp. FLAS-F59071]